MVELSTINIFNEIIALIKKCNPNLSNGIKSMTVEQIHKKLPSKITITECKVALEILIQRKLLLTDNIDLFHLYYNSDLAMQRGNSQNDLSNFLGTLQLLETMQTYEEKLRL